MNILRFLVPKSAVEYITSDATVRQAFEKMRYHRYVAIPVLDDEGIYIGTLRSDDIYEYFLDNGKVDYRAAERDGLIKILDKNYYPPLTHGASVEDMIEYVNEHNFVPVVDDRGCFIGIILRRDVLRFLFNCYKEAKSKEQ